MGMLQEKIRNCAHQAMDKDCLDDIGVIGDWDHVQETVSVWGHIT